MPSIINATTTAGVAVTGDNSGALALQTNNGTTAVTIDTSQNVGIGTTSPSNKLSVLTASGSDGFISVSSPTTETAGVLVNGGTSSNKGAIVRLQKGASTKWTMGTDSAIIGGTSDNFHLYGGGADSILFSTNAAERMRIDSSGNLLVGTASSNGFKSQVVTASNQDGISVKINNANQALRLEQTVSGNNVLFRTVNGTGFFWDTIVGTGSTPPFIIQNQTATGAYIAWGATSWTGTSDEKLKNITGEISNGVEKVCSLRAAEFTWKSDETAKAQVGLIAQDVEKVLPEAISENEGVLGVRYTEVIPLLVAAIKELNAKVEAQAAEIAVLKGAK